jgi:hypothetical protein
MQKGNATIIGEGDQVCYGLDAGKELNGFLVDKVMAVVPNRPKHNGSKADAGARPN